MDQPIQDRLKKLEERMDKVEQLQQTEPINVRVERGLSLGEETMLKTIMDMVGKQGPDIGNLKVRMERVEADIKAIRESQADFRDALKDQSKKLDRIVAFLESKGME